MLVHQPSPSQSAHVSADAQTVAKLCKHCKISFAGRPAAAEGFCCRGCEGAWLIVNSLGLQQFYRMTRESELSPAATSAKNFEIYDSEDFQSAFCSITSDGRSEARLLIEGITCYACVWLIRQALERKFKSDSHLAPASVNINQSTGSAILQWDKTKLQLSELISFIESLGYAVMPHRSQSSSDSSELLRTGVGLFIMMNVMSFALAEYFAGSDGLDPALGSFLRWLSLVLTTASLLYPGREFFVNTTRAIKARAPNIDGPILLGLLAAYLWSLKSTIQGHGQVYFDSICAIIALVVTGRFVQKNVLRRNQTRMASLLNPRDGWVLVKQDDGGQQLWQPRRASDVRKGDTIRVLPGEMFPLKVTCANACAEISFEQLKGETEWKSVSSGDLIPAGALNGSSPVEARAEQNGTESYTETLGRSIERAIHEKGSFQQWADRASWSLFVIIFCVAAAVFATTATHNLQDAMSRVVAILLVACPCTFAIGVPLAFGTSMTQALQSGILFKSQRSLEALARANTFVFDKTGTLTIGKVRVKEWTWNPDTSMAERDLLLTATSYLDQYSSHHVAQAISEHVRSQSGDTPRKPDTIKETQGQGMELAYGTDTIKIGRPRFVAGLSYTDHGDTQATWMSVNNRVIAKMRLDDATRDDAAGVIQQLQSQGNQIHVISGDTTSRTRDVAKNLNISLPHVHGNATPGGKTLFIRQIKSKNHVAMVGNGLNDAGAMATSDISIAVASSSSTAMNSSDICLLLNDLNLVAKASLCSKNTMRRIYTVFAFAVAYNLIGLTLAAAGLVSPVVAAVLMPISSITITHIATSWKIIPDAKSVALSRNGKA